MTDLVWGSDVTPSISRMQDLYPGPTGTFNVDSSRVGAPMPSVYRIGLMVSVPWCVSIHSGGFLVENSCPRKTWLGPKTGRLDWVCIQLV
jgi:hypothetical protein